MLEHLGFVFKRQRGSHVILRRGNRGCVVPMHREISRGTLRGVLEQAGVTLGRQLILGTEGPTVVRVLSRDAFGNAVPFAGLRAAVGDDHVVRVTAVTSDSLGGWVTLRAGHAGTTNLVVQGAGVRADLSAVVRP